MKLFVGIVTCRKNLAKIEYLRKTWLKDLKNYNIEYKIFIGKNDDVVSNNDIIVLDVDVDYESLKQKTRGVLEYANKNIEYDYILKTDDDTFVDVYNLKHLNFDLKQYVGWFSCIKMHKRMLSNYIEYMKKRSLRKNLDHSFIDKLDIGLVYAVGGYYLLKKDIVLPLLNIINSDPLFTEILQEDISIGYACSKINASTFDLYSKFNWYQVSSNNTFFHPINFMIMEELYNNKDYTKRLKILENKIILNNNFRFRLK
jgi:hypothetical protein